MGYKFNRYDTEKFIDGDWVEIDGGQFKIAKFGNPAHLEASERIEKEMRRRYNGKDIPTAVKLENVAREYAEGLLRDWRDMEGQDEDGNPVQVPYSIENATELLLNDEPLRNRIRQEAGDLARFEKEYVDEQAGKRGASSGGGTSGRKKGSKTPTANTAE
ncbi:hypothetical protein [Modicisalibacter coralii]|uniref:hypothetical protein n=1 Tax=Modicisalibacter coralii TaxID=2304602 RepID=UPI00100B3525|nr:hypothetical protein [Halomonas coralii]